MFTFLLLCCLSTFSALYAVNVSFVNFTPYEFEITFKQTSTPLPKDIFSTYTNVIRPFTQEKICNFPKNRGIENRKEYIFEETLTSKTFPQAKILLGQRLVGKKIWLVPYNDLWWQLGITHANELSLSQWYNNNRYTWDEAAYQTCFVLKDNKNIQHHFLMRYRHKKDNVEYVLSGINLPHAYQTQSTEGHPETINILNWNLYLMTKKSMRIPPGPWGKEADKPAVGKRSQLIPDAIGINYDVLVFSEAWDPEARKNLLVELKRLGYRYATCILGSGFLWQGNETRYRKKGFPLKQQWIIDFYDQRFGENTLYTQADDGTSFPQAPYGNGGVIIISKHPILEAFELIYTEAGPTDKNAKKGCLYAKINKEGKTYHIIGTHPDASAGDTGPTMRAEQFKELRKFMDWLKIPTTEPLILAGDFNVNKFNTQEYHQMIVTLNVTLPRLIGTEKVTSDRFNNLLNIYMGYKFDDVIYNNLYPSAYFDYVFYSDDHQRPSKAFNEIRVLTYGSKPIPESPSWSEYLKIYDLSDHYAIYAQMAF